MGQVRRLETQEEQLKAKMKAQEEQMNQMGETVRAQTQQINGLEDEVKALEQESDRQLSHIQAMGAEVQEACSQLWQLLELQIPAVVVVAMEEVLAPAPVQEAQE